MVRFLKWLLSFFEKPSPSPQELSDQIAEMERIDQGGVNGPPLPKEDANVFKPDVLVYEYWDGSRMVKADPMELARRWAERVQVIETDSKTLREVPNYDKADEIYAGLIKNVRWVFDVKPLGEGGLPETESLQLYHHFTDFLGGLKKKQGPGHDASPPTESAPPPSA